MLSGYKFTGKERDAESQLDYFEGKWGQPELSDFSREVPANWREALKNQEAEQESGLRSCTYAGRRFAEEPFVAAIAEKFGRYWNRGRPRKNKGSKQDKTDSEPVDLASRQFLLF